MQKKIEGRKRKLSPVCHQTCIVPSRNHEPSSELLRFVRGVCRNFGQTSQFLPHHLGGMTLHQPRFHVLLIVFQFFGFKMPCHSMHTYACVHVVRQICLKIPSNLLHMELTRRQVHKNMICQTVMVRRCMQMQFRFELRSLNGQKITYMSLKGQMTPGIFQIFTWQLYQCTLI